MIATVATIAWSKCSPGKAKAAPEDREFFVGRSVCACLPDRQQNQAVIPAKAGTQLPVRVELDPGFRRDDVPIVCIFSMEASSAGKMKAAPGIFCILVKHPGCGLLTLVMLPV